MMAQQKTYDEGYRVGLLEGRVYAEETRGDNQDARMGGHSRRLRLLERIVWVYAGVAVATESFPLVEKLVGQ